MNCWILELVLYICGLWGLFSFNEMHGIRHRYLLTWPARIRTRRLQVIHTYDGLNATVPNRENGFMYGCLVRRTSLSPSIDLVYLLHRRRNILDIFVFPFNTLLFSVCMIEPALVASNSEDAQTSRLVTCQPQIN